jgi:DNA-binding CsgD family transcriptional regulator
MEPLTFQDTQNLLHAVQELYSLRDLDSFGVKALTIVDRLVPSETPVFHLNNLQSRQIFYTVLPGHPCLTPELEAVPHRYWGEHPITQNMPRTLFGAYKISDFISQKALHRLEGLYQQFMRVIDCEDMMVLFGIPPNPQSWDEFLQGNANIFGMTLSRNQSNFTERDRLILNLLRPHLFQAYDNTQRYRQLQQNLTQLHQDLDRLGLIILNPSGQILFITSPAIQYLQTYFAQPPNTLYIPDHLWAWVRYQTSLATQNSDLSNPHLPLKIEQDSKQLVVRFIIESQQDRYLLLLEEQTEALLPSLALLGLSPRETEVLFWLIRGQDNQAIANHLSIHFSTVRKHLESIFHKLGVQSRTEAIALALESLGFLNASPLT